jgi:hypothetical protein
MRMLAFIHDVDVDVGGWPSVSRLEGIACPDRFCFDLPLPKTRPEQEKHSESKVF